MVVSGRTTMNCVDLFSGIGGFARALRGISTPILYCDADPVVRDSLKLLMRKRKIPRADIIDDVRRSDAIVEAVAGRPVDLIVASSPCIGFSTAGSRRGLENKQSGLVMEAISLVERLKPRLVFFENVSAILSSDSGGDLRHILDALTALGYDMRWTVVSAADAGAPHVRKRWFCLCILRNGIGHLPQLPPIGRFQKTQWRPESRPPLTTSDPLGPVSKQMGNALVPQSARMAFYRLYSGFRPPGRTPVSFQCACVPCSINGQANQDFRRVGRFHVHACLENGGDIVACEAPVSIQHVQTNIVVRPDHFKGNALYKGVLPRITEGSVHLSKWPTPRALNARHSHGLTKRVLNDLATVAMFAAVVDGSPQPSPKVGDRINPAFVCWLMGFPVDWLDA